MSDLRILGRPDEEAAVAEHYIRMKASPSRALRILEAGCGRHWPLNLEGVEYTLTGLDIDQHALEIRTKRTGDLDDAIVADLRTAVLPEGTYDVIYNSYVLEHVKGAECVLDNFVRWLRPGGLLILRIPDRDTVYGLATRVTPHCSHVLYRRWIRGDRKAGLPGYGPYRVYYDLVVSRRGIIRYCMANGLTIRAEYGLARYLQGRGMVIASIRIFAKLVSRLSLGRLPWTHNNLLYIIEK